MKKILIVAYSYLPLNGIGANRPASWAKHLAKFGLHPTVLTRHWNTLEEHEGEWILEDPSPQVVEKHDSHRVIRFPYIDRFKRIRKIPIIGKLFTLIAEAFGVIGLDRDAVQFAKGFLRNFKGEDVDFVIATSPKISTVKAGFILAKRLKVPLVLDFRDIWDNRLLNPEFSPNFRLRLRLGIWEIHLKRWIRQSSLVTAVTPGMLEQVVRLVPTANAIVIPNGFEEEDFNEPLSSPLTNSKFTFSVIGTLYPIQDFSCLIDGMKLFISDKNLDSVELRFIGTGIYPDVARRLETELPKGCVTVTKRIPRNQAVEMMRRSDVLFYIGWRGLKGWASGKIYEYLAARRNILIAPGDNDVLDELMARTNAGRVANTPNEFNAILSAWYREWKETGTVSYHGIEGEITKYTRESQAKELAMQILRLSAD